MVLNKTADLQPPPYLEKPDKMAEDNKSTTSESSFATSQCSTCPEYVKVSHADGFSKKYIAFLIIFIVLLFAGMYVLLSVTQAAECCRKMEERLENMHRNIDLAQTMAVNQPNLTENLNQAIQNPNRSHGSKSEEPVNKCELLLNQYRRLKRRQTPRHFHRYLHSSRLRIACDNACAGNCDHLLPTGSQDSGSSPSETIFSPIPPHLLFPAPFHPVSGSPMLPPSLPAPHEMMSPLNPLRSFVIPISLGGAAEGSLQPLLNDIFKTGFFGCSIRPTERCATKENFNKN